MKLDSSPKTLVFPKDVKPSKKIFRVRGAFNPAAVRLPNNKIMLFARVAETPYHDDKTFVAPRFVGTKDLEWKIERISRKKMTLCPDCFLMDENITRLPTISHFRRIILDKSGEQVEHISDVPNFFGVRGDGDFGVEDARISAIDNGSRYAMTYVSVSIDSGVSTSLATSNNLSSWKRHGVIFRQQNKDVVIFPKKFGKYYAALHRPEGTMVFDRPSIWISYSKDLLFWGKDRPLIKPRHKAWDGLRIGSGTVPIKTSEGWLEIYHGVKLSKHSDPDSHKVYSAGALLFDSKNPEKLLGRTHPKDPLFEAELDSEMKGFNDHVVFPTAMVPSLDKKNLLVYGGGADSVTTMRKLSVKAVLNSLK
ncbi:MAG: hypothetical protein NUV67_06160 [archaeon]|nr:hypothetical protein [archaeon]